MSIIYVAGVDEAGRGPLAGPVIAAAVILDPNKPIVGLKDSKKLTVTKREALAELIRAQALAWAVGRAEVDEIDTLNILQASLCAMQRAVAGLSLTPGKVLVDGNRCPALSMSAEAIVGGDDCVAEISAASIIAKVVRDQEMLQLHAQFPLYGFDQHKGYPTRLHMSRLQQYGICAQHRRSYAPVQNVLRQTTLF